MAVGRALFGGFKSYSDVVALDIEVGKICPVDHSRFKPDGISQKPGAEHLFVGQVLLAAFKPVFIGKVYPLKSADVKTSVKSNTRFKRRSADVPQGLERIVFPG